ncbi:MAG: ATP-binding protein [Candidatus Hodarchaeales archaeon]
MNEKTDKADLFERYEIPEEFKILLENLSTGVYILDKNNIIIFVNNEVTKILGYSKDKFIGNDFFSFLEKNQEEKVKSLFTDQSQNYLPRVEFIHENGSNTTVNVTVPLFSGKNQTSPITIVSIIDISEFILIEKILLNISKRLLSEVSIKDLSDLILSGAKSITNSPYGFVGYIDTETGFLVAPTMTSDIWGECKVPDKGAIFRSFKGLYGWVLENKVPLICNNPSEDPRSIGVPEGHIPIRRFISVPVLFRNGELIGQIALANSESDYTDEDIRSLERLGAFFAIVIDRVRLENGQQDLILRLNQEKRRIEMIIKSISDGILFIEADGSFSHFNHKFEEIYKFIYKSPIPQSYSELKFFENDFGNQIIKLFTTRTEGIIVIEPHPDFFIELNSRCLYSKEKKFLGMVIEVRDITEKRLFDTLRSEFISMIPHELRTPITSITLALEVFNKYRYKISDEKQNKLLKTMQNNIEILSEMIEDLLLISGIEAREFSLDWKKININDCLRLALEKLDYRRQEKNIKIIIQAIPDIIIHGDIRRLKQVLYVLIDNAIKYSPKDSSVTIEIIDSYEGGYNPRKTDGILIQVIDKGMGIKNHELLKLFTRFYRSESVKHIPGSGLGLSIAKELIALHQGEIFVESEYGFGTTFSIFLPKNKE